MTQEFEIEATSERVGAWSAFRLPYEPKDDDVRRFRDDVRTAIRGLARHPVLHAAYTSSDPTPCDAENVVLYNVGSGAFSGLGTESIIVERPPGWSPRAPSGAPLVHFLSYRAFPTPVAWQAWRPHRPLVTWTGAPVSGSLTATSVWVALKGALPQVHRMWDGVRPLGLTLRISSPRRLSLVSVVKSLVDGAISAAHVHEGDDIVEMAAHVAMKLRMRPQVPLAWISDATAAVLGPRRLVHPRDLGFQWNPADDKVVALTLSQEPGAAPATSISAEICTVVPAEVERP